MEEKKRKLVFVVDDDELLANMLADHIAKNNNAVVRIFHTGEDCVKEILHTHPDVIVLDYFLNSEYADALNGLQILDILNKLDKKVHVIMLSSQERYGVALKTIEHGAERYVIKGEGAFSEVSDIISTIS